MQKRESQGVGDTKGGFWTHRKLNPLKLTLRGHRIKSCGLVNIPVGRIGQVLITGTTASEQRLVCAGLRVHVVAGGSHATIALGPPIGIIVVVGAVVVGPVGPIVPAAVAPLSFIGETAGAVTAIAVGVIVSVIGAATVVLALIGNTSGAVATITSVAVVSAVISPTINVPASVTVPVGVWAILLAHIAQAARRITSVAGTAGKSVVAVAVATIAPLAFVRETPGAVPASVAIAIVVARVVVSVVVARVVVATVVVEEGLVGRGLLLIAAVGAVGINVLAVGGAAVCVRGWKELYNMKQRREKVIELCNRANC